MRLGMHGPDLESPVRAIEVSNCDFECSPVADRQKPVLDNKHACHPILMHIVFANLILVTKRNLHLRKGYL